MKIDFFKTIILSLSLIFLCHYLFNYLQATFTVPKVKDMINRPNEKYETIMKIVKNENKIKEQETSMKNELDTYINEINSKKGTNENLVDNSSTSLEYTNINSVVDSNNQTNNSEIISNNNATAMSDTTPISQLNNYS